MGKGSERTLQMAGKPTKRYSTRLAIRKIQTKTTVRYHCTPIRRKQWHPTPVLLPRKSHGQRSLEGCSPWGRWGSDMTERLHFLFSLSCIGEGNGNPLQCSCLESPRDGEAWWAAVYGVTQSRTRLKWLSNSNSNSTSIRKAITVKTDNKERMWRNWDAHTLLVGMQNSAVPSENSQEHLKVLNKKLLHEPAVPLLGIYPGETEMCVHTRLYTNAYSTVSNKWKQHKHPWSHEWIN